MKATAGFTLIEVLVALVLATGVITITTTLWRVSAASRARLHDVLVSQLETHDAMRILEDAWLQRTESSFEGNEGLISFSLKPTASGQRHMSFACVKQSGSNFFVLLSQTKSVSLTGSVSTTQQPATLTNQYPGSSLLVGNLTACSFGYLLAPVDPASPAKWVREWSKNHSVPNVIRLDISTSRGPIPPCILAVPAI